MNSFIVRVESPDVNSSLQSSIDSRVNGYFTSLTDQRSIHLSFSSTSAQVTLGAGFGGAGGRGTTGHCHSCQLDTIRPTGVSRLALTLVRLRSERRYSHDTAGLRRRLDQALPLCVVRLTRRFWIPARLPKYLTRSASTCCC